MRQFKKALYAMAAAAVTLTAVASSAGAAVAEPALPSSPQEKFVKETEGAPTAAKVPTKGDVGAQAIPCGTSFAPLNPMGGPLNHYYNNCAAYSLEVMAGYYDSRDGLHHVWCSTRTPLSYSNNNHNGDMVHWYYSSTIPSGVNYNTYFNPSVVC